MLEQTGLLGMIGKAERGPAAIEAIRDNKAVYLMAVGGAAYLVSKAIKKPPGGGLRRPGHGGDLRVRGEGHAGHSGGRLSASWSRWVMVCHSSSLLLARPNFRPTSTRSPR
jgi:hypothetical protein